MSDPPMTTAPSIDEIVDRARSAMAEFAAASQESVDQTVRALAWSLYKPPNARHLAELAVRETSLGNVDSKVVKNMRKTFGTLRDLLRVRTVGTIEEDLDRGLVKIGKPVGVVGAVCPSTNPSATPVNNAMMAVKGRNSIIIAPSPSGYRSSARTVELMRNELERCRRPVDLVQVLPPPVSRQATLELVGKVDLAVVTGSQNNVRQAMRSGTVTIGVGPGNVPIIIDSSADLADAASKIAASKVFDNSTSCSSENALVIMDDVYESAIAELERAGGWRCSTEERDLIAGRLWKDGSLNREVIAKDAHVAAEVFGLPDAARSSRFFMVEETRPDGAGGFADEKLSLVLTIYRSPDFAAAKRIVRTILRIKGKGHSVGIHTGNESHARELALETDVVRVLVNQSHTFGNGGGFDNGLPFTLSMGGGTWAGNSISENLNYRHFINITHLVTRIPEDRPTEEELFGPYWDRYGR